MKPYLKIGAAALCAVFAFQIASDADARERRTRVTGQGERGAVTGESVVNRGAGYRHRSATVTGENGRQRSVEDNRAWSREDGAYSRDHNVTRANGATRNVATDAQRTGEGQYEAQRTVTGANGETRTQSGTFAVERTETGRSVTGDIQTTNAGQVDYNRDVARGDGTRAVNSSATFEDGTSISRNSSASCANGACASTGAITNRQGETTIWSQSRTKTENGANASRDVTYSDGSTRSVDRSREGNGDGTGEVTRTVTGRDGETRTQTGTYQVETTP